MSATRLKSAKHYLDEAQRLQREAKATNDAITRQQLLTVAMGYVDLAKSAEILDETSLSINGSTERSTRAEGRTSAKALSGARRGLVSRLRWAAAG
jgi:hypothetical protein